MISFSELLKIIYVLSYVSNYFDTHLILDCNKHIALRFEEKVIHFRLILMKYKKHHLFKL